MSKTVIKTTIIIVTAIAAVGIILYGIKARQGFRSPIKVFPYYCSANPYSANVGGYSEVLLYSDVKGLKQLSHSIKRSPDDYPIEIMFILAIRLWDEDEMELALYWYYCASFRTDVLTLCRTNESTKGDYKIAPLLNFKRQIGKVIRNWQRRNGDETAKAINDARKDCRGTQVNDTVYPTLSKRKGMVECIAIALTDASYEEMAAHAASQGRR